jgi:hypothetical protein
MRVEPVQFLNVDEWLQWWAKEGIESKKRVEDKSGMRSLAAACATDAREADISIPELKQAAHGDLEEYLMRCQNAAAERGKD